MKPVIQVLVSPIVIATGFWLASKAWHSPSLGDRIIGAVGSAMHFALGLASLIFGVRALMAA